jgi:putative transposase
MLACDFLTVETVMFTRIYVLFVVSLERRRVEFVATTKNPDGRWATQQARNLMIQLGEGDRRFQYLIRDRDSKFSFDFRRRVPQRGHPDHPYPGPRPKRERLG